MRRPDPEARSVLADHARASSRAARLHTTVRWWSCPFAAVEAEVPIAGDVLDLGCGHGHLSHYLARRAPGRHVLGVDVDADKVTHGRRVTIGAGLGGRVELEAVDPGWRPDPEAHDAVVIVDVLYLLGRAAALDLVAAAAAAVRPGGVLVVKEMGDRPRWKWAVNEVQERLATRVLGITEGDHVEVVPLDDVAATMSAAGLDVTVRRVDRGYPHAHALVVGRRADAAVAARLVPDDGHGLEPDPPR